MIHFHGTPLGGSRDEVARFARRRHFFVPFLRQEDLPVVAEHGQSFAFDTSAYTAWMQCIEMQWDAYYELVGQWMWHPRFAFAVIPDVIDGSEEENDRLLIEWPHREGVPVWHLHESLSRLERLVSEYRTVGFGSSGKFSVVGSPSWSRRMGEAMSVATDELGRPKCRLHGFRMLDPSVVESYPFASCDSTNVAQNASLVRRFGNYCPPTRSQRCEVIASRIEATQSPAVWVPAQEMQRELELFRGLDDD